MRTSLLFILVINLILISACTSEITIANTITQTQTETRQSQEITTTITTTQPAQTVTDTFTSTITTTNTTTSSVTITIQPPTTAPAVQLISQEDCGQNQVCYTVTVDDNNIPTREAEIRVTHISGANGFVVFAGGGWGKTWFGDGSDAGVQIMASMHDNGYETYEIEWTGEQGWGDGCIGQGFMETTRAFSLVIKWISDELADNPEFSGVVGISAGSVLVGYGLTVHGLEDIVDIAILTAGPMHSDLEDTCYVYGKGMRAIIIDYLMGWIDNGDCCQVGEGSEWTHEALRAESIVSEVPGEVRDYDYPTTKVVFVEGENDEAAINLAIIFHDVITTEKEWIVIPDVGHGVLGSPDAVNIIIQRLLAN
jgi:hypothetical protein